MARIVSLSVLLTLIIILGLTFFQVLAPFLLPLFLAGVFSILAQPLRRALVDRLKGRERVASALTTGTVVGIILVPVVTLTVLSSLQLYAVANNLRNSDWTRTFRERTEPLLQFVADVLNNHMRETLPDDQDAASNGEDEPKSDPAATESASLAVPTTAAETDSPPPEALPPPNPDPVDDGTPAVPDETATGVTAEPLEMKRFTPAGIRSRLETFARTSLFEVGSRSLGSAGRTISGTFDVLSYALVAVVSFIIGFLVFVIALYYFLADGAVLLAATEKLIPVHAEYQREVLAQFSRVVRSVVMATFCAGIVQAVAVVIALWFFGFEHLLVLLVLAILTSMVPLLGTWPIWLPCALWLLWNGHWVQALLLTIYGAAFVGLLDNVVRTYILNTDAKLHPLLALISVLGGLKAMGLWGVFIGPIVASCLHALVKIFNHELTVLSLERFGIEAAAPDGGTTTAGDSPASPPGPANPARSSKHRRKRS